MVSPSCCYFAMRSKAPCCLHHPSPNRPHLHHCRRAAREQNKSCCLQISVYRQERAYWNGKYEPVSASRPELSAPFGRGLAGDTIKSSSCLPCCVPLQQRITAHPRVFMTSAHCFAVRLPGFLSSLFLVTYCDTSRWEAASRAHSVLVRWHLGILNNSRCG